MKLHRLPESRAKMVVERKNWPTHRRAWQVLCDEGPTGILNRTRQALAFQVHRWHGAPTNYIYDERFYKGTQEVNDRFVAALADWIVDTFSPVDVFDVGCGDGMLLRALHKNGIGCYGVDGSANAVARLPISIFAFAHDLSKPLKLNRTFPFVICLEVAEHLPSKSAATIVKSITDVAESHVLFSAAHPGQGGCDHINEQPLDYWIGKFNQNGFVPAHILSEAAKLCLRNAEGPQYFQRNLIVLRRNGRPERSIGAGDLPR
jgi:2-polyprenyl-3-methyl-5-hydroxy-6-metoxy-1,4-benzoquinol methylase